VFDRKSWRALAAGAALPLDEGELRGLASLGDRIDLDEVSTVYLSLAGLLHLHVEASRRLWAARSEFLGDSTAKVPYVIAVAGSVAVGKSTTARLLQTLLAAGPSAPRVDLVTTDGFLLPNAELEARGLLGRKGFPESYDRRALLRFLAAVKSGQGAVSAPLYDHQTYDIVPGGQQVVDGPDILVLEGLNVLQAGRRADGSTAEVFLSDFFDFSVYVDAAEAGVPGQLGVLPPVRRPDRRAGPGHRAGHLGRRQRAQPAQQHRPHPLAGPAGAAEGRRPQGPPRPAAQDLTPSRSARPGRPWRVLTTRWDEVVRFVT
jgi:type I pantothenate kinase